MAVFVLDRQGTPLMPCSEKRARILLERGRARVVREKPFVIRLVDRLASESEFQKLYWKCDPGSKKTGMALVLLCEDGSEKVQFLLELEHRGDLIRDKLTQRSVRCWRFAVWGEGSINVPAWTNRVEFGDTAPERSKSTDSRQEIW